MTVTFDRAEVKPCDGSTTKLCCDGKGCYEPDEKHCCNYGTGKMCNNNQSGCKGHFSLIIGFVFVFALIELCIAEEPNSPLEWSIKTDKEEFFPGEPLLLTIDIVNKGTQQEKVDFEWNGISAFSFNICNLENSVVQEGKQILPKEGLSTIGYIIVPSNQMVERKIILNRWCSTLLPIGKYHIICRIDYRLYSEDKPQPNTIVKKAGPIHYKQLETNFEIVKTDMDKLKEIIADLTNESFKEILPGTKNFKELDSQRELAREMLTFTENDFAIPYQIKLLEMEKYTWNKADIISSLVKSNNISAVEGLVQIVEDPNIDKGDVRQNIINGVYTLRETGKPEIMSAINDFVVKYKRPPTQLMPMD